MLLPTSRHRPLYEFFPPIYSSLREPITHPSWLSKVSLAHMASLSILRILTVLLTLGLHLTHAAHHIPLRKSETDGSTYLQNWQKRGHIIARRDVHKNWQDSQYHRRADGIIERHHTSRSPGSRRRSQPHLAAYKRSQNLDPSVDNQPRDETDGGWFATLTRSLAGSPIINAESTSLSNSVTQPPASNQPSGASVSSSQNSAPGQPTGTQSAGVPQSSQPFLPIEYVGSYAWTIDMKFGPEQVVAPILVSRSRYHIPCIGSPFIR